MTSQTNERWFDAIQRAYSWLVRDHGFVATFQQAGPERWVRFRRDEIQVTVSQEMGGATWTKVCALDREKIREHALERLAATPEAKSLMLPSWSPEEAPIRSVVRAVLEGRAKVLFEQADKGLGWVDGHR